MTTEVIWSAFADELEKVARVGFLARPSAGKMGRAALLGLGVGGAGLAAAGAESTGRLTGEVQGRLDQAERQRSDMARSAMSEAGGLSFLYPQPEQERRVAGAIEALQAAAQGHATARQARLDPALSSPFSMRR